MSSSGEKVDAFSPFLILIYVLELIILGIDYTDDGVVRWSIPIIGSIFLIQLYMIWKTNYDEMMEEQRQAMGGPNVPEFDPSSDNMSDYYKSEEPQSSKKTSPSNQMINLNVSSASGDSSTNNEDKSE